MTEHDIHTADAMIEARNVLLREKKVDPAIIRKAWFTLAHLLLPDGAQIVDMGCGDGAMTFVMAAIAPHLNFTGLDKDKRKINKAKVRFELDNLEFKVGDAASAVFGKESLDAVIDSYVLHEIYSGSRYNEQIVSEALAQHHLMLKKGGQLFVRDYARPPPEEFVLIEMPDEASPSDNLKDLSEADLLVWYSEHARPKHDPGCGGFFLEELPAQFPRTRLFRLPYKWAYEFIMRKDDRSHWETELPMEYTFFTAHEMRKAVRALGMRVQYAAPHWDDDIVRENFDGKFRLYKDDGTPMDVPPVCYIVSATKMAERKSLQLLERRPSQATQSKISIHAMKNEKTGQLVDIARRDSDVSEVIPYHVAENGRLKIFLHDGLARSVTNAVPRSGSNLGEQRWSGHMIEALSIESDHIPKAEAVDVKSSLKFTREHVGLKPAANSLLEAGPDYYPSPDFIDERIFTFFINVMKPSKAPSQPKSIFSVHRFQAKGDLHEFDAQQILDAISVGMIPNARLEMQILCLFQKMGIKAENWTKKHVQMEAGGVIRNTSLRKAIGDLKLQDNMFKDVRGSANQLRRVHSVFVEEGQSRGAVAGLSFEDVDFVFHNHETVNVAVVLPMTKDQKNNVHAAINIDQMPVPQRHEGNGMTLSAPQFTLPPEVTNLRLAKKFLSGKFGVLPENIIKMGEPYFTHIGMTPQKIHPFVVVVPHAMLDDPTAVVMPYYQLALINMDQRFKKSTHFMTLIGRSYRLLHDEVGFDAKASAKYMANQQFNYSKPEFTMPLSYHRAPSLPDITTDAPAPEPAPVAAKAITKPEVSSRPVSLQENLPPNFDGQSPESVPAAKPEPIKLGTIAKVKDMVTKPFITKPKREDAPPMADDFDAELDAFIEEIATIDNDSSPRPEKW